MPHIIIEYTTDMIQQEQVSDLVDTVFLCVKATSLFKTENIKVRAIPIDTYRLGIEKKGFIHVQCRIHQGRSRDQKALLTEHIMTDLRNCFQNIAVMTTEVVDMERESYRKNLQK